MIIQYNNLVLFQTLNRVPACQRPLAAAEVSPVGVGAGVLAGAVPVVQQALVLVRAERTLGAIQWTFTI